MNTPNAMQALRQPLRDYAARHFRFTASGDGRVATIALNRPERKNPLTFDSYAELRDLFRDLAHGSDVRAIVLTGAGGNFSSGGDVFEIIEPLTRMTTPDLLAFTRMTGDVVKAIRKCPQPVIAAVDGVCAGAGAILAMACASQRRKRRPRFSSPASGSLARTWARVESCRGSSAKAARRSFSIPVGQCAPLKDRRGASTMLSIQAPTSSGRRSRLPARLPTAPGLRMG
jgi:1,4-dihydroxy-2-naphthoyl-CoA synthase